MKALALALVATAAASCTVDPGPVVTDPIVVVELTPTTTPDIADTNVYRSADGHCFGLSPTAAAERGLAPDPACP